MLPSHDPLTSLCELPMLFKAISRLTVNLLKNVDKLAKEFWREVGALPFSYLSLLCGSCFKSIPI